MKITKCVNCNGGGTIDKNGTCYICPICSGSGITKAPDSCVCCGAITPYDESTDISVRFYYVEGSGQLCESCYNKIYK